MVSKKDFNIGDLVWAKMKGFPFWPGEIAYPPTGAKSKKAHHYVFFFGTENFAWILDGNIVFHSEDMLKAASTKKKSTLLKTAIEEISERASKIAIEEISEKASETTNEEISEKASETANEEISEKASETAIEEISEKASETAIEEISETAIEEISEKASETTKLPVQEKESPGVSTSGNERKVAKARSIKSKTPKIQKKIAPKKRSLNESASEKRASNESAPKKRASNESAPKKHASNKSSPKKRASNESAPKKRASNESAPKKRALNESANGSSPPSKSARKTDDFSELINNTPPNLNYDSVNIVPLEKPLDVIQLDDDDPAPSTEVSWHEYFDIEPRPSLNLSEPNPKIIAKNVRPIDKKIGFIGLGLMGQRLVKNLLTTRHNVMIWNRTAEKCEDFAKVGALVAKSPADLIEKCDVVFCCVSGREASKAVIFGENGIMEGLEKSPSETKGYIELTTLDPDTSITLSDAIVQKGGQYLESPITGSFKMAEEGSLFIVNAGNYDLFSTYQSCFFALSESSYFLSHDVGSGSKMNLIISMLIGISHAALAEAMALVEHLKLSEENFLEIVELGPLNSRLVREKGKAILARYFVANSTLKYQQRDLHLALVYGSSCEQPLPVTAAANEVFKHAKGLSYSDHDVSAVFLGARY